MQGWHFSTQQVCAMHLGLKLVSLPITKSTVPPVILQTQVANMRMLRTQHINSKCIHYKGNMIGMLLHLINFLPKYSFICHANKLFWKKAPFRAWIKLASSLLHCIRKFSFNIRTCEAWKFSFTVLHLTKLSMCYKLLSDLSSQERSTTSEKEKKKQYYLVYFVAN